MDILDDIRDPVNVSAVFKRNLQEVVIRSIVWRHRKHPIYEVTYAYPTRKGRTLLFTFHAVSKGIVFRLEFDTESLTWVVTGVHAYEFDRSDVYDATEHDLAH